MRTTALRGLACATLLSAAACDNGGTGGNGGGGSGGGPPLPPGCDALVHAGLTTPEIQTIFIEVQTGQTICISEETTAIDQEVSLDVDGVTIKGTSPDLSVLDFSTQTVGGQALLIKGNDVVMQDFKLVNSPGDGIRADQVTNVTFQNVQVIWDADASMESGAYGLYPVGTDGVRIENCVVKGARDAGIYVGQSTHILVKDSQAYGNVAGIEIENSTDAEVVGNHAHDNSAGILVFNLPGLVMQGGARAKVHDNVVENNNGVNFGDPGTTIGSLPSGIGMMLLCTDDNELHANTITGNETSGVVILNWLEVVLGTYNDPNFDPWPEGNFIHDNTFSNNGMNPDMGVALLVGANPVPDIVWTGCVEDPMTIQFNCVDMNGSATYINANLCGQWMASEANLAQVTCTYPSLPPQDP